MRKLILFIFIVLFQSLLGKDLQEKCYVISEGSHFSSLIPFHGFVNTDYQFAQIKLDSNAASYLFKTEDPKGRLCINSWNKLFGSSRCGYLNHAHIDSDRFVWRRAQQCVKFENQFSVGEYQNCEEKDLIEIAAYAYDNGSKPFAQENQGKLLKIFNTKVKINEWYGYGLRLLRTSTQYELFNSNGDLLEQLTIEHRDCGSGFKTGGNLRFYFGGQCPAPQLVSACYRE